jgi:uncharacterized protein YacL
MDQKTIYGTLWEKGIQPEVVEFLEGLNWNFILMFIVILYGLKHTSHFNKFESLLERANINKYKIWISALIIGLIFCFFKWKEELISWLYVSNLLRSVFVGVVFSNVFVDIPVFLIKRLGSIIDNKKEAPAPAPTTRKKKKIN